jgi:catechol 2,3-dioxygenase-like lactoylglutathione lyase family enzyme
MLAESDLVAFAATTDCDRARAFYGGTLGLRLVHEDGFAVVFEAHGTALRVSLVQQLAPAPYTVLGWRVGDVRATVAGLAARGVLFERYDGLPQDELGIWTAPDGSQVAWFKDPDGNLLSVTQPA